MPFLHSVQGKLTALLVSVSVLVTLIVGGFFIYSTVRDNDAAEMAYRKNLEEQYDQILKLQTEGLITALNAIYKRQMSGELTEEQAKDLAADLIRSDRYDDGKGYFFADEKDTGICVVHAGQPAAEGTMRQEAKDTNGFYYMKEIFKVAQAPGGGYCNFNYPKPGETESLPKRGYSVEFKPYQWIVGTGSWIDYIDDAAAAHIAENREALYQKILMSVIIMVAVTIIMTVAGARLAKRFADPISFVTRRLQKFAEGDYRQEPVNPAFAAAQDETGQMIQGISALGVNMRKLLNAMGTSAEQVAGNASQLNEMTEQSSAASNQIAESITDVAGSTNKQLAAVDEASQSMTRLSERIGLVFDHAKKAATETVQATETARNGNAVVERTVADMERLNEVVGESAKTVNDLGERSEAIGKITETISGIAEQTNLLALNAAIEAARAGEQGRGFAVVADEIRKLAAQSDEATKQISTLITQIQQETAHAVNSMEQGTDQLSTTRSSVEEAGHEFQSIVQLVETIAKRSKEIEDASREVSGNAENCQKAIHAIEEMSRNVVSNSETVSAATEEQAASIHEMAISSQQLSEMATSLQKEVAHFKV